MYVCVFIFLSCRSVMCVSVRVYVLGEQVKRRCGGGLGAGGMGGSREGRERGVEGESQLAVGKGVMGQVKEKNGEEGE